MSELKAKDYIGQPLNIRQGQPFISWNRIGFTSITVLQNLSDKLWDDIALAYVHALRPSHIRVVYNQIQCDAQVWRVTVYLKSDRKTINFIEQEVQVGLPEGCEDSTKLPYHI